MKTNHRAKVLNALRVNQSAASKKHAADAFRERRLDAALRRALVAIKEPAISQAS